MIRTAPHLRSIVTADGAVILDAYRDTMTTLNDTGALIWKCLSEGAEPSEIITALAERGSVDPVVVAEDFDSFVGELKAKKLIIVS